MNKPSEYTDEKHSAAGACPYDRQAAVDYAHFYTRGQGQKRRKYIRYISGAADSFLSWENPDCFFYYQNCAAFLSQCLSLGGGLPMTESWHQRRSCRRKSSGRRRRLLSGLLLAVQRLRLMLRLDRWDVSPAWREAEASFKYFSDPAEGYISSEPVCIESAGEIPLLLKLGSVQCGDIIYLEKEGKIAHCLLVTGLSDSEIYYCANKYTRYDMELSFAFREKGRTRAFLLHMADSVPAERK